MEPSAKFYTQFASSYDSYAAKRKGYLSAVNSFIKKEIGSAEHVVDIGAGDGNRLTEVIRLIGHSVDATLVDNSDGMINALKKAGFPKVIKADIASPEFHLNEEYDIAFCLWNVLGHIPTDKGRGAALSNIAKLLKKDGYLFLDVNNRYNAAHYGIAAVARNILRDLFRPRAENGDFKLSVDISGHLVETSVHIFSPIEMEKLIRSAGLKVVKRTVINYETGRTVNNTWSGQLVYKLAKA